MTLIARSALVLHPAEMMFDLVNDIESYPQYMDGCEAAQVISRSGEEVIARLQLGKAGIRHSFTTRNRLHRPERIEMSLESGPFTQFHGEWRFEALRDDACKVSLTLEFQLKSGILHLAAGKLFTRVANNLVAATTARANVMAARP